MGNLDKDIERMLQASLNDIRIFNDKLRTELLLEEAERIVERVFRSSGE